jgi:predicted transcriptional regulator
MPSSDNSTTQLTTKIVASFMRRNHLAADQLGTLISTVHQALAQLGKPAEAASERIPAVSIRRSITPNFVVCLDCGHRAKVLRRHLTMAHGLTVAKYRERWNLSGDHPMTAPAYSERRSTMAKELGLGRGGRGAAPATTAVPATESVTARTPPLSAADDRDQRQWPSNRSGTSALRDIGSQRAIDGRTPDPKSPSDVGRGMPAAFAATAQESRSRASKDRPHERDQLNTALDQQFAMSISREVCAAVLPPSLRYLMCSMNARSLGKT